LSGFRQNIFTDLIRRLLQVFKIEGDGQGYEPVTTQMTRIVKEEQPGNGKA
jgi:hypothetical protein